MGPPSGPNQGIQALDRLIAWKYATRELCNISSWIQSPPVWKELNFKRFSSSKSLHHLEMRGRRTPSSWWNKTAVPILCRLQKTQPSHWAQLLFSCPYGGVHQLIGRRLYSLGVIHKQRLLEVEIASGEGNKTAFSSDHGIFKSIRTPFRLENAPGPYQRLMDINLSTVDCQLPLVYLDDIVKFFKSPEANIKHTKRFLALLPHAASLSSWRSANSFQTSLPTWATSLTPDY